MPLVKHYCPLSPPSLRDNTATLDRLAKHLRRAAGGWPVAPLPLVADFAATIRAAGHQVTATLAAGPAGPVLVAVEPGDVSARAPDP
ncbi:MAG: hypothetical protein V1797_20440, partial [Pseudomonadota bacterium]